MRIKFLPCLILASLALSNIAGATPTAVIQNGTESWELNVSSDGNTVRFSRSYWSVESSNRGGEVECNCFSTIGLSLDKPVMHSGHSCRVASLPDYEYFTDDPPSHFTNSSYDIATFKQLVEKVQWNVVEHSTGISTLRNRVYFALSHLSS